MQQALIRVKKTIKKLYVKIAVFVRGAYAIQLVVAVGCTSVSLRCTVKLSSVETQLTMIRGDRLVEVSLCTTCITMSHDIAAVICCSVLRIGTAVTTTIASRSRSLL